MAATDKWSSGPSYRFSGCQSHVFPARMEGPGFRVDKEILRPPRRWAEARFNVKQWTMMKSGGHFAALEEPEALVDDIRSFFRQVR